MGVKDWIILLLVLLAAFLFWIGSRRRRVSGQSPTKANARAKAVLEEAGYEILKVKPVVEVSMTIDDKPVPFELKNDYLVSRQGRRFLVCIRRENKQTRLQSKLWRGNMLRDVMAFRADGIVVLNLEKETFHEVRFKL